VSAPAASTLGDYTLIRELGRGRRATVHLARERQGAESALKVFDAPLRSEESAALLRAAESSLEHPQLVPILRAGERFAAMGLVNGAAIKGPIAVPAACVMIAEIAGGVEALHKSGALHLHLCPRKILIDASGIPRLIGLDRGGLGEPELGFAAPEQVIGGEVDRRADVYGLAAVLFELVTKRPYRRPGPPEEMRRAAIEEAFVPPSRFRADLPARFDAVLEGALAFEVDHRFKDVRAFAEALSEVSLLEDTTTIASLIDAHGSGTFSLADFYREGDVLAGWEQRKPPPKPARAPRPTRRRRERRLPLILAVLPSVVAASIGVYMALEPQPDRAPPPPPPVEEAVETPSPRAVPMPPPSAAPKERIDPEPEQLEPEPRTDPRGPRPRRKAPAPRTTSAEAAPVIEPPPPESASPPRAEMIEIRSLIARLRKLRASKGDPVKADVDRLIAALVLEAGATDDGRSERISRFRQEVGALEARAESAAGH
jgi:serine/threonine-protein kinase